MTLSSNRRTLLIAGGLSTLLNACAVGAPKPDNNALITQKLAELEKKSGGRLGVMAIDNAGGASSNRVGYRQSERFPFCSTFKVVLAGAVLNRSLEDSTLLQRRLRFSAKDLVSYSPVTEKAVGAGMTVSGLCAAGLQYSDNTAANLLIAELGGIGAVNDYARSIGDTEFRLDRIETALNTAIPGDARDTTTPLAMAQTLQKLTLGELLPTLQRRMLIDWMRGNTTGGTRIRAALPRDWQVGDKTGSGDYGTTNDVAVIWPGNNASPVVLSIYFTQTAENAPMRNDVVADAARIVAEHFI
ncbi:class A beta-lactamase [Herbaspirillum sp. alder98]|uniref:class A beta-lactamase n=1 Tax=Herbaspirillum sp. alder98 TaxID=2913096 RepID=UPI001CD89A8D|nr:class A beta-lactamase [Herbaspirillum sp. alder98]MCA1323858.1 class A beta-lactamase [Herbaspirillum sp. alder98]